MGTFRLPRCPQRTSLSDLGPKLGWLGWLGWLACSVACFEPTPASPPDPKPAAASAPPRRLPTPPVAKRSPAGRPSAAVRRLCRLLHTYPRERRATCCETTAKFSLQPECEKRLHAFVTDGSIAVPEATVDRCAASLKRTLSGCDWLGPIWEPVPRDCLGVLQGRLQAGAECRSHLSCPDGMHCAGLSTTQAGRCRRPRSVGQACDLGPDELATVLRQDDLEARHPPCEGGYCRLGRCAAFNSVDQPCGAKNGCGPDARCVEGLCTAGALGQLGDRCEVASCADGLRCARGRCQKPRGPGERCATDDECFGTCVNRKCRRTCDMPPTYRRISRPG